MREDNSRPVGARSAKRDDFLEAKVLLKHTTQGAPEIACQTGHNELSVFHRFSKSKKGMSPGEYQKMVNPGR
jgi:YesN/AraC family two-component response regulator